MTVMTDWALRTSYLSQFNFKAAVRELFLGKLRYNVLALVPDRADVVLCQT